MTDISIQHLNPEPREPRPVFVGGDPGEDLPLSSAIYRAAENYGKNSQVVDEAIFAAVKALEIEVVNLRAAG
ncbi:MAG: hypothetical protein NTW76_02105 [Corynebacteriales bacterium]|nr:hypothetical protein [Mycobacteriales bacterium]